MSKKAVRKKEIIRILQMNNGATVKDLALMLEVSEMTIRRDLCGLEAEGLVNLVHGAAIYNAQSLNRRIREYNLIVAKSINNEAKNRIGKAAANLIEENDYVIVDLGSTTEKIVSNLPMNKKFTLICYASNIMVSAITKPNVRVIMGGGEYKPETMMFVSNQTLRMLEDVRANKVFISASGIDKNFGVTCMNSYEIEFKRTAKKNGLEVILVADSGKFGKVDNAYFGDISDFSTVITDKDLPVKWEKYLRQRDIRVIKA